MRSAAVVALGSALLPVFAGAAQALTFDHLACYRVKDPAARATYAADLVPGAAAGLPAAPGCRIRVPAKLLCVDTAKTNPTPTPPGAPDGAAAQRYLCYGLKCPAPSAALAVTDQFGARQVELRAPRLLCAPVAASTTTTTTTLPPGGCALGSDAGGPICAGTCAPGFVCRSAPPPPTGPVEPTCGCVESGFDCETISNQNLFCVEFGYCARPGDYCYPDLLLDPLFCVCHPSPYMP